MATREIKIKMVGHKVPRWVIPANGLLRRVGLGVAVRIDSDRDRRGGLLMRCRYRLCRVGVSRDLEASR